MNATYPKAKPKSDEGGVILDGLYVNERGHTEPVFVLRASEPGANALMISVLRDMRSFGYAPDFMHTADMQFEAMLRWRAESGLPARREADSTVYESTLLPLQEKPSAKTKK